MRDTILFGECRQTLKQFDEQARTCITSPPYYGLRDYGGEENQIGQVFAPVQFDSLPHHSHANHSKEGMLHTSLPVHQIL